MFVIHFQVAKVDPIYVVLSSKRSAYHKMHNCALSYGSTLLVATEKWHSAQWNSLSKRGCSLKAEIADGPGATQQFLPGRRFIFFTTSSLYGLYAAGVDGY